MGLGHDIIFENLPSIVFTTPSVPLVGDRNPQGREDVTALSAVSAPPVPPAGEGPYPIPKP